MNWAKIWMDLFGTTALWGVDMGFWAAMAAVMLIVLLMKPKKGSGEAGT